MNIKEEEFVDLLEFIKSSTTALKMRDAVEFLEASGRTATEASLTLMTALRSGVLVELHNYVLEVP